jgi:trk system potassium uptake protein TrkA
VSLKGEEAEVLEAIALETSGIVDRPIADLELPPGVIVLAVLRGKESFIPTGGTVIRPQDRVVILAARHSMRSVEEQLAVKLEYF